MSCFEQGLSWEKCGVNLRCGCDSLNRLFWDSTGLISDMNVKKGESAIQIKLMCVNMQVDFDILNQV